MSQYVNRWYRPHGVLCVYPGPLHVPLDQRLLDHALLLLLLLLRLFGEPGQLLGAEPQLEQRILHPSARPEHSLSVMCSRY